MIPTSFSSIIGSKVAAGYDARVSRLSVRLETLLGTWLKADVHNEVRLCDRGHCEKIRLHMHDVLDLLYLLQRILGQDAVLSHHVDMPHGPSGPKLEQRVDVALQNFRLALNRGTDGLHDEKQEKRDCDQNDDNGESQLASEKIA
jgi:hypothetical protein